MAKQIFLTPAQAKKIKRLAQENNVSEGEIVNLAIEAFEILGGLSKEMERSTQKAHTDLDKGLANLNSTLAELKNKRTKAKPESWENFFKQGPCSDFPDPRASNPVTITVDFPVGLMEKIEKASERKGITPDEWITAAASAHCDRGDKKGQVDTQGQGDTEELFEKSNLLIKIEDYIFTCGIEKAAEKLCITESKAQALAKGLIDDFTVEEMEGIADKVPSSFSSPFAGTGGVKTKATTQDILDAVRDSRSRKGKY